MKKNLYWIVASPYATQYGTIVVPDNVEPEEYIKEHWDEIDFDEPELDYAGTDFEFGIEQED